MGRLNKQGLDFYIDMCDTDDNWKLLSAEYGLISYGVLVVLLRKIYGQKGYYTEWNDRVNILLASEFNTDRNTIKEIVKSAAEIGIFDKTLFERYAILTSTEIQDRYLNATVRRKNVIILPEYNISTVDLCQHNEDKSTQRRVEESRVEESIAEESIAEYRRAEESTEKAASASPAKKEYGEYQNVELTDEEYEQLKSEYPDHESRIDRLSAYMMTSGKEYRSHYAVIREWAKAEDKAKQKRDETAPSFDADEFFELALRRSREKLSTTS